MSDRVRVLRVIEYDGTREWVEKTIQMSFTGEHLFPGRGSIRVATLGTFPEILEQPEPAAPTDD